MSNDCADTEQKNYNPFRNLTRLNNSLRTLDERGLVLSLAAFAEEALGDLVLAYLRDVKASRGLVTGFNAPLGTFSNRIKAASALGLIDDEQTTDLECLRKIRNEFAHTWNEISLDRESVAALIHTMSFSYLTDELPKTNRDKLRDSISGLLTEIQSEIHQIRIKKSRLPVFPHRLYPSFNESSTPKIDQARAILATLTAALPALVAEERRFYVSRLRLFELQMKQFCAHVPEKLRQEAIDLREAGNQLIKIYT